MLTDDFEWDDDKAARNLNKHRVSFEAATFAFDDPHALDDPDGFVDYYASDIVALASEAWLGPAYQVTSQVNVVNPGGQAQSPHRDYHLGFLSDEAASRYPQHVHRLSPVLTLQGAIAHTDMPVASGPTTVTLRRPIVPSTIQSIRCMPEIGVYASAVGGGVATGACSGTAASAAGWQRATAGEPAIRTANSDACQAPRVSMSTIIRERASIRFNRIGSTDAR